MTIHIANTKVVGNVGEYVARPSPLESPFPIDDFNSREMVCFRYKMRFEELIREGNNSTTDELNHLLAKYEKESILTLRCWCAPLQCHAETIRDWLYENAYSSDSSF